MALLVSIGGHSEARPTRSACGGFCGGPLKPTCGMVMLRNFFKVGWSSQDTRSFKQTATRLFPHQALGEVFVFDLRHAIRARRIGQATYEAGGSSGPVIDKRLSTVTPLCFLPFRWQNILQKEGPSNDRDGGLLCGRLVLAWNQERTGRG